MANPKKKELRQPEAMRNPMRAQLFDPSCRASRRTVERNRKAYTRKVKHRDGALY
ncbi:hypothetical protein [Croceicoccus sp. Ery15]|uniref:hypothetical protein n=1 Tax=Croceicoccus sp. Ery15 TaxID=1703338 RepID=UPI001E3710F8|nr:hypothetical protein [Croceicoccus sp. Ery15]